MKRLEKQKMEKFGSIKMRATWKQVDIASVAKNLLCDYS
jgi:hypothetical protein